MKKILIITIATLSYVLITSQATSSDDSPTTPFDNNPPSKTSEGRSPYWYCAAISQSGLGER